MRALYFDDSIAWYLKEIDKIPSLTPDEEITLGKLSRDGCEKSRNKLVESNLKFVVYIAKGFNCTDIPFMDLINEGNLGLIKAAEKFDPDNGFNFISYSVNWIKQSIMFALKQKKHLVRLPMNKMVKAGQIESVRDELRTLFLCEPTSEDIAQRMNIDSREVELITCAKRHPLSLDYKFYNESIDCDYDFIDLEDKSIKEPDEGINNEFLRSKFNIMFKALSEREQKVIALRYGLDGENGCTLRWIGKQINLSQEMIRQIIRKALLKMRAIAEDENLELFLK